MLRHISNLSWVQLSVIDWIEKKHGVINGYEWDIYIYLWCKTGYVHFYVLSVIVYPVLDGCRWDQQNSLMYSQGATSYIQQEGPRCEDHWKPQWRFFEGIFRAKWLGNSFGAFRSLFWGPLAIIHFRLGFSDFPWNKPTILGYPHDCGTPQYCWNTCCFAGAPCLVRPCAREVKLYIKSA